MEDRLQRIEKQLKVEAAARLAAEALVSEEQSARNGERAETAALREQVRSHPVWNGKCDKFWASLLAYCPDFASVELPNRRRTILQRYI